MILNETGILSEKINKMNLVPEGELDAFCCSMGSELEHRNR